MEALFACTKCHSRHLFEDLSPGEQLCKECRNNYPVVKCTYCRVEFQLENRSSSICKKCDQSVKSYGKPTSCEYCSVLAAFIGNLCQVCANSEKKWGLPITCDQCKQQCAFSRNDDSRKKVDGKLLCWLCTNAYRRALNRTRKAAGADSMHSIPQSASGATSVLAAATDNTPKSGAESRLECASVGPHHHHRRQHHHGKHVSGGHRGDKRPAGEGGGEADEKGGKEDRSRHRGKKTESGEAREGSTGDGAKVTTSPLVKRAKVDRTTSTNGLTKGTMIDSSFLDFGGTDNMIVITQLKEEVQALKKQLTAKEQQILERDKKITEIRADHFQIEKNMRTKVQSLSRQNLESMTNMKEQNRALLKQVATLSKSHKKTNTSNNSPSLTL